MKKVFALFPGREGKARLTAIRTAVHGILPPDSRLTPLFSYDSTILPSHRPGTFFVSLPVIPSIGFIFKY